MMKRIMTLVLSVLFLLTSAAGCAKKNDHDSGKEPGEERVDLNIDKNITEELSILIPGGNENEKTMIDGLIRSFNEIYPNVTFKLSYVAVNSYENTIRNLYRTGSLDDIVWTNSPDFYYLADKKIAVDLNPYVEASEKAGVFCAERDFYKEFLDMSSVNGKLYAVPRSADSVVTFVNKDLLTKAGVDLNPGTTVVKDGWTWDDFLSVCAKVRAYLDKSGKNAHYVCDANLTIWLSTNYPILRSYGADMLDLNGKNCIDSEETRECLNMIRSMVENRYIVDTSKESGSSFETGTSAFLFQSASISLFANRPALKGKVDLVSFPLIMNKNTPKIGAGIAGYSINTKAKNKNLCWAFLSHMLSYDGQQAMGSNGLNLASIRRDLSDYRTANWGKGYEDINLAAYLYGSEYKIIPDYLSRVDVSYKSDLERALKSLFNNTCNISKDLEKSIKACVKDIENAMI